MSDSKRESITSDTVWDAIQASPADVFVTNQILPIRRIEEVEPPFGEQSALCYYTTAETAFKILSSESLWLRTPAVMNDSGEVRYGFTTIEDALEKPGGKRFRQLIEELHPESLTTSFGIVRQLDEDMLRDSFMACFCKHSLDDKFGLLSMWRAYGRGSGVAFVFNSSILTKLKEVGITTEPVRYWDAEEFSTHLGELADMIGKNKETVREARYMKVLLASWLGNQVLTLKNKAFREEQEYRSIKIGSGSLHPRLSKRPELIGGIPQLICELNMRHSAAETTSFPSLLTTLAYIIVGPFSHAKEVSAALKLMLQRRGFGPAADLVFQADIPLR